MTFYFGGGYKSDSDPGTAFNDAYKQNRLARLLSDAYQAPEEGRRGLLAQMMGVDPRFGMEAAKSLDPRMRSGSASGVQSTYIDDQGRRIAIMRDGSVQVLGNNAPQNQIIDTGDGFFGVNKSSLRATPVQVGGQQQAQPMPAGQQPASREVPFRIDPSLPPEVQAAIRANEGQWANATEDAPIEIGQQGGGQLKKAPPQITPYQQALLNRPPPAITPYQQEQLRLAEQRTNIASEARNAALEAKKAADAVKADSARRADEARQAEASGAANQLVSAIDRLTNSPGFTDLGTELGDLKLKTPLIRSGVKDADAQLKNIAGQVALSTMARLKSLSSSGATGFGALSALELKLLENALATLQSDRISNAELRTSLKTIRDSMTKVEGWKPGKAQQGAASQPSGVDDLLKKYGVK